MKKRFITDIRAGDRVDDIFVLSEKILSQKKDGNNFLNITLSDKTGTIKGVVWDNVDQIAAVSQQKEILPKANLYAAKTFSHTINRY